MGSHSSCDDSVKWVFTSISNEVSFKQVKDMVNPCNDDNLVNSTKDKTSKTKWQVKNPFCSSKNIAFNSMEDRANDKEGQS